MPDMVVLVPNILFTFREFLEPALIIAIVVFFLKRLKKNEFSWLIYSSIAIAIIFNVFLSWMIHLEYWEPSSTIIHLFELIGSFILAFILTYIIIHFNNQHVNQRSTKVEIVGIIILSIVSILKRFSSVHVLITSFITDPFEVTIGVAIGSIFIMGLTLLITSIMLKLKTDKLIRYFSFFLLLFAAGSLGYTTHKFIEVSPNFSLDIGILEKSLYDINPPLNLDGSYHILHEKGILGSMLSATFGYDGDPEWLRVITYVSYLLVFCSFVLKRKGIVADHKSQVVQSLKMSSSKNDMIRGEDNFLNIYSELSKSYLDKRVKSLEGVVEDQSEKLKEAERLATIGQTAAMVGHDLRNPLQTIYSILYLVNEELKTFSSKRGEKLNLEEMLVSLEEQVEYMDKIVSDLQDYARPLNLELAETIIRQLIDNTLSSISVPKNVKVIVEADKRLSQVIDPEMIRRVLTNLCTNAIQAMTDGGNLIIKTYKIKNDLLIEVHDTGEGIPKENITKIFRPLFTTKAKGQGFGLAVCQRIVEAHNGKITVKSDIGKGTIFTFNLPEIRV
jgi:FTR1 family protein